MHKFIKWPLALITAGIGLNIAGTAAHAEMYIVVRLTDYKGHVSYHSLPSKEFDAANKWIRSETAFFGTAQRKAETDWKEENEESYPGRKLKPQKLKVEKRAPNEDLALEYLQKLEDKLARRIAFKNSKYDNFDPRKDKKRIDKAEEKAAKEAEKEAAMDSALPYLQKHLVEMIQSQPGMADKQPPFEGGAEVEEEAAEEKGGGGH